MSDLPKTMKALVAYAKGDYRLETDFPVPECGEDDIIIKTEACGICAGDLKCQHGAAMFWGDEKEVPWVKPPFIPGHEFLGHIVKLGANVNNFSLGERITADQIVPAGNAVSAEAEGTGCASPTPFSASREPTTAVWRNM